MGVEERRQAFDEDDPYRMRVGTGYPPLVEAGKELRCEGVRFYDMSLLLKDYPQPLYFDTCSYFNQRGSDILADPAARLVADGLGTYGPVSPKDRG